MTAKCNYLYLNGVKIKGDVRKLWFFIPCRVNQVVKNFSQNGRQRKVEGRKCFVPTRRRLLPFFKEIAQSGEDVTSTDEVEGLNMDQDELTAIRNKRIELDAIQTDLDDLMERLNVFIGESVGLTDGK